MRDILLFILFFVLGLALGLHYGLNNSNPEDPMITQLDRIAESTNGIHQNLQVLTTLIHGIECDVPKGGVWLWDPGNSQGGQE